MLWSVRSITHRNRLQSVQNYSHLESLYCTPQRWRWRRCVRCFTLLRCEFPRFLGIYRSPFDWGGRSACLAHMKREGEGGELLENKLYWLRCVGRDEEDRWLELKRFEVFRCYSDLALDESVILEGDCPRDFLIRLDESEVDKFRERDCWMRLVREDWHR